jgi:hypothetical protein
MTDKKKVDISNEGKDTDKEVGLLPQDIQKHCDSYRCNECLEPLPNELSGRSAIPTEILLEAIKIRVDHPKCSVSQLIRVLEMDNMIERNSIKRSTLQKQLFDNGFGKVHLNDLAKIMRPDVHRCRERNSLWLSSCVHRLNFLNQKGCLISFLDNYTRLCLHSQFYLTDTNESLMDCFRQCIEKFGVPTMVHFDNGIPSRSLAIERSCGILGICKIRSRAYQGGIKAKIERIRHFVEDFSSEIRLGHVQSLSELNKRWHSFLEEKYQTVPISAHNVKMSPLAAWNADAAPLLFVDKDKLIKAFPVASPESPVERQDISALVTKRKKRRKT